MQHVIKAPHRKLLQKKYEAHLPALEELLKKLQESIQVALKKTSLRATVTGRVKTFDSYYNKLLKQLMLFQDNRQALVITDIIAIRIICPFLDDLKAAAKLINDTFQVIEEEHKGALYSFKEFGYESIHLLIKVPMAFHWKSPIMETPICEIQLRTILQEAWAEVEHALIYKTDFSPLDVPLKRKLAALNANLTLSDILFQEIRDYQNELQYELKKRRESFLTHVQALTDIVSPGRAANRSVENAMLALKDELNTHDTSSSTLDDLLMEALRAHNAGTFDKAIKTYTKILQFALNEHIQSIIYSHRGMSYLAAGNYDKAIKDFTRAITLDNKNYKALYYRGVAYQIGENYRAALMDYDACLHLHPYHADAQYSRSQVYFHLGDYPKALADCEQVLNLQPDYFQIQKFYQLLKEYVQFTGVG